MQGELGFWRKFFVGIGTNPVLVAAFRTFVFQVVPGLLALLTIYLSAVNDARWLWLTVPLASLMRVLEGVFDQAVKAYQNSLRPTVQGGATDVAYNKPPIPAPPLPRSESELRGDLPNDRPGIT